MEKYRIYKRLKDIREDLDMSQEDIAKKLKVERSVYSKWEREIEIMPLNRVNQFANITGYSLDYISGLTNNNKKTNSKQEINKKETGIRLRNIRKSMKISQKQLANPLNTTQSTISAYENGKTLILSAFLYQICKKYSISMDWFCGRTEKYKIT